MVIDVVYQDYDDIDIFGDDHFHKDHHFHHHQNAPEPDSFCSCRWVGDVVAMEGDVVR